MPSWIGLQPHFLTDTTELLSSYIATSSHQWLQVWRNFNIIWQLNSHHNTELKLEVGLWNNAVFSQHKQKPDSFTFASSSWYLITLQPHSKSLGMFIVCNLLPVWEATVQRVYVQYHIVRPIDLQYNAQSSPLGYNGLCRPAWDTPPASVNDALSSLRNGATGHTKPTKNIH